jgi:hypothetical protein
MPFTAGRNNFQFNSKKFTAATYNANIRSIAATQSLDAKSWLHSLILAVSLLLILSACGQDGATPEYSEQAPQISIQSPGNGVNVARTDLLVQGMVSGGSEGVHVTVTLDETHTIHASGYPDFSATIPVALLTLGAHTITAAATSAGDLSASESVLVTVADTTPPNISINTPMNGATLQAGHISISGTSSDDADLVSVAISIDNDEPIDLSGINAWNYDWNAIDASAGTHTIVVTAHDAANNSAQDTIHIVLNTDALNIVDDWPLDGHVNTPISRATFVPYQRISKPTRLGVQAWSKNGIDRVEFAISGGGYRGTNPLISGVRRFNPDNGVYDEYFVTIDPSDFTTAGVITITPTAYGRDGGARTVGDFPMVMNQSGMLDHHEVWVEKITNGGNDMTAVVDDKSNPFETIPAAISALYSAYGDRVDGGIVWLGEGNWTADTAVNNTTINEWLTIARNPDALRENVIFNTQNAMRKSFDTAHLHLKEISIGRTSAALSAYTLPAIATNIWLDHCLVTGNGITYKGGNYTNGHAYIDPIQPRAAAVYSTGSEFTHSYRALSFPILSVNDYIHNICEDAYQLGYCVIQPRIDHLDPTTFTDLQGKHPHADVFQMHAQGGQNNPENVILYGFNATDIHYQGFFWRPSSVSGNHADNIAMVNNMIYLIDTAYFNSIQGVYDHLLMWNNTFAGPNRTSLYKDTTTSDFGFTNSSLVGNYFYALEVSAGGTTGYSTIFESGNSNNNEAISNHYNISKADGYGTIQSASPDTGVDTATVGTQEIDESDLVNYVNLGRPITDKSKLIDRLSHNRTSFDLHGNARDLTSDVGAWEYVP